MATQVRIKPATTQATKTSVSTSQSVELMKTLLLVSTSTIAFGRSIFSERHFERRGIEPKDNDASFTYDKFVTQEPVDLFEAQRSKKSKGQFCLQRGISDKADHFLDWLEKSVFDAMERKALRAFQLKLLEDPEAPNDVLETWTFKITYPDEAGRAPRVGGIEIRGKDGRSTTLNDAKVNINDTVKSIGQQMNLMPYLPVNKHLGIFFWYTDDCDPDYQPPGFEDCELSDLNFPGPDLCELNTVQLRPYQDGVHGFQVATTHIERVYCDMEGDEGQTLPANLPCNRKVDANADIKMLDAGSVGAIPEVSLPATNKALQAAPPSLPSSRTVSPTPPTVNGALMRDGGDQQIVQVQNDHQNEDAVPIAPTIAKVEELTLTERSGAVIDVEQPSMPMSSQQSQMSVLSVDERVGKELRRMANSIDAADRYIGGTQIRQADNIMLPPAAHGKTLSQSSQAQGGFGVDHLRDMVGSLTDDSLIENDSMDLDRVNTIQPLCFSQKYLDVLKRHKEKGQEKSDAPASTARPRTRASQSVQAPSNNVNCECGTVTEETDMLQCMCCDKRQHIECYGYRGATDPRIPRQQACYSCLLPASQEQPLLNEMRTIALERRIVHLIETQSLSSDTAIKNALDMSNIRPVQAVTTKLKRSGFLIEKQGQATGTSRKPKPDWSIVSKGAKCDQLKLELFDPTTKIAHMFDTESLISHEPLATNYYTLTTDSLMRTSSLGISKLGHPPALSAMEVYQSRESGTTITSYQSAQASTVAAQNVNIPSTPTSSRRKRTRNDTDADHVSDTGERPKRRMRNSKAKDYLDVSGLMS